MKKQLKLKEHELDLDVKIKVQVKRVEILSQYIIFIKGRSPILPKKNSLYITQVLPDTILHSIKNPDILITQYIHSGIKSIFNELIKTAKESETDEKVELT